MPALVRACWWTGELLHLAELDHCTDWQASLPQHALSACRASWGRASLRRCRVAEDASVPDVQPAPSLPEQFGLHCSVVRHLTGGFPYKVRRPAGAAPSLTE
jgi:hypothetical protein